eukprot:1147406-Pelagomonas_calceolata.AAC.4
MRQATKKRAHRLNPILHRLMGQRLMRHRLRWGKDALARASPGLTSLLLLWLLAIYTATSLQHYYGIIPPVRTLSCANACCRDNLKCLFKCARLLREGLRNGGSN